MALVPVGAARCDLGLAGGVSTVFLRWWRWRRCAPTEVETNHRRAQSTERRYDLVEAVAGDLGTEEEEVDRGADDEESQHASH